MKFKSKIYLNYEDIMSMCHNITYDVSKIKPDIIVVLGDRYEIFSAVSAAMIARIPIAHLHGGEATEGLIDEAIRHSISKMSHLHFTATEEYRNRVIQLGENLVIRVQLEVMEIMMPQVWILKSPV